MKQKKDKKRIDKSLEYYMSLNYPIIFEEYVEEGKTRFGLKIPDLPGVWADGGSVEEALENLRETKEFWIEAGCI